MKIKLAIVVFLISIKAFSQDPTNKWVASVSLAFAGYSKVDGAKVGGQLVYQSPRFGLARYITKGIIFEAAFATAIGDTQKYTTFDGFARYDFNNSYDKIVPYVMIGGSFISAKSFTPTLNFGIGNTIWISPRIGLHGQIIYKFSENRFVSQKSHIYASGGLVYSFKPRANGARLWEVKH